MKTTTTLNTGSFNGRCYRHVRVSKPHTKSEVWWVLDDGNYFKTLPALIRHVEASSCNKTKAACPDAHLCRCGIDN